MITIGRVNLPIVIVCVKIQLPPNLFVSILVTGKLLTHPSLGLGLGLGLGLELTKTLWWLSSSPQTGIDPFILVK